MVDEDQRRGRGAAESGPSTTDDAGSKERDTGDRPVAGAVNKTASEAKAGLEKAAEAPSMDFKAVLRNALRAVADEVKAAITQAVAETAAPAARKATVSALTYVTTKGPGLVENAVKTTILPKLKESGGRVWRGRGEDAEVRTEEGEQPPAEGERQPAEATAKAAKAEGQPAEAEEREEGEAESSAQGQVRRRAPGRLSRPK
jgi:hypothetical protein